MCWAPITIACSCYHGNRPIPHHQLVEDYVKAYYVPDEEAEKWLKDHTVCHVPIPKFNNTLFIYF